jgi:hypothetical protein
MGLKLKGLDATLSTFREVDRRFTEAAGEAIGDGAKEIAALARKYAPEDKGDLTRSIRALRVKDGNATKWRIKVGGMQGSRNVDAYAWAAHEGYSTNRKSWKLSKKSLRKGARLHYLAVAFAQASPGIARRISAALKNESAQLAKPRSRK